MCSKCSNDEIKLEVRKQKNKFLITLIRIVALTRKIKSTFMNAVKLA